MESLRYTAEQRRQQWLHSGRLDPETRRTVEAMTEDETLEAFGEPMTFGTAGLRSVMGPGISRMNVYTVAHVTFGLASLIRQEGKEAMRSGVVIAHDSRHHSRAFAVRAAEVLSACGIRVYLFPGLRPTPVLSFAVRRLGCTAGINITASHNAKEYNGYKVYWRDGSQIAPAQAAAVSAAVAASDIFRDVPQPEKSVADRIETIPGTLDEEYLQEVAAQAVNPQVIRQAAEQLRVVYTPLYGTGRVLVPEILRRCGLLALFPVEAQMSPNGDFPTTPYPNPESPAVFFLGIHLAEEQGADLLIATDPDADRVGTMVRASDGTFRTVTGNQMGALLLEYLLTSYRENGRMPPEPYVVKSFVTTELASRICAENGVTLEDVLTGFKYVGEAIARHEETGRGTFLFGFEESYGYLKGTYARDKDAVVASMLVCEMAAYYRLRKMSLLDALSALWKKYGYYQEISFSVQVGGTDAGARMQRMMERLRETVLPSIAGVAVTQVRDYRSGVVTDTGSGVKSATGLPETDALYYVTEQDTRVIIRPSGTEPKVKIYVMARGESEAEAAQITDASRRFMQALLEESH